MTQEYSFSGQLNGECRCMLCNIDMGSNNPRQVCGKTQCDYFQLGIFHTDPIYKEKYQNATQKEKLNILLNEIYSFKESLQYFKNDFEINKGYIKKKFANLKLDKISELEELSNSIDIMDDKLFFKNLLIRECKIRKKFIPLFEEILNNPK